MSFSHYNILRLKKKILIDDVKFLTYLRIIQIKFLNVKKSPISTAFSFNSLFFFKPCFKASSLGFKKSCEKFL